MAKKTNLCLYILCAILVQEIVGKFLEDDLGDSTNSLVRQKRVINRIVGEDIPVPISTAGYTVNIKVNNRMRCMGTIVSMKTVITAARCADLNISTYTVYSGSIYINHGFPHNVTEKRLHANHPVHGQNFQTGVALMYIHPSFYSNRNIAVISLHTGPILEGMEGTIRGWGSYYFGGPCESNFSRRLREIKVPIINHRVCVNKFRGFFEITESHFCTHDVNQQCGYVDTGASFIVEHSLAGIYVGHIQTGGDSHMNPDVFMMPQNSEYRQWILRNIEQ